MKLIAPDYYAKFRCIADKCRHSCCVGWEIDIDADTRDMYRRVPGAFGERLNAAIENGEVSSFRLDGEERCPMLNQNGLCDLITELGEGALCQICADHPRYRNYFADRTEIGLGLCCEEAARLILSQAEPVELVTLEDDGGQEELSAVELSLLGLRELLIGIMQDRSVPVSWRLEYMMNALGSSMPVWPREKIIGVFRGLERLDPAWDDALDSLQDADYPPEELDVAFEQFAVYMLYRHLPGALEDDDAVGRARMTGLSVLLLMLLCGAHAKRHGSCTLADCIEYARMYSAEIEYDEDNIAALLAALEEETDGDFA